MTRFGFCLSLFLILILFPVMTAAGTHSFSFGAHYFYSLDDIRSDIDDDIKDAYHRDGVGFNAAYRYKPNKILGIMLEVQSVPDGFYDAENVISPRLLFLLGHILYAGAGIGTNYVSWENNTEFLHNDDNWSDPYFMLRGGLDLPFLIPRLRLDLNLSYEFNEWNDVNYFDSDAITFGAGLRINL
jgi:opacity protein-like surface antigen